MPVYVSRPVSFLPPHVVSREEILADMVARHPDHPRLGAVRRVVGRMPAQRQFSQPWPVVLSDRSLEERNRTAFADVVAMGTAAARGALDAVGIGPQGAAAAVDCVVTSCSTADAVPGLDVHLVQELGLSAQVSRRPMTQLGCGGGGHGLVLAADFVRARPGSTVLVVAAESLSSIYHHGDTTIEAMIYKALWGDSAVAVLVSDRPLGPGLEIVETWEYLLPGSAARYRKRLDGDGVHFDSEKTATDSVRDCGPDLRKWLDGPALGRSGGAGGVVPGRSGGAGGVVGGPGSGGGWWPVEFVVAHTGGPVILDQLREEVAVEEQLLVHSRASLDEDGNLGGPSVLRVLERTYAAAPAVGERGLLLGFGPGFSVSAAKVVWHNG